PFHDHFPDMLVTGLEFVQVGTYGTRGAGIIQRMTDRTGRHSLGHEYGLTLFELGGVRLGCHTHTCDAPQECTGTTGQYGILHAYILATLQCCLCCQQDENAPVRARWLNMPGEPGRL